MAAPLFPGDSITYGLTQELPYPKGASTYVKYAATTTIRAGETATQAKRRLQGHVEAALDRKITEIISEGG